MAGSKAVWRSFTERMKRKRVILYINLIPKVDFRSLPDSEMPGGSEIDSFKTLILFVWIFSFSARLSAQLAWRHYSRKD